MEHNSTVEWVPYMHLVRGSNPCAPICGRVERNTIPGPYPVFRDSYGILIAPTTWVWCRRSGNLSPVHIPILLQRYRSTDRELFGFSSKTLSHPLRGFVTCATGTTIRRSSIKLQRTYRIRGSNPYGILPAVFETASSTSSDNPAYAPGEIRTLKPVQAQHP